MKSLHRISQQLRWTFELPGQRLPTRRACSPLGASFEKLGGCKHILAAIGWALASAMVLAQTAPEPRIRFGPIGRPICEDYVKLLNQAKPQEPLQVCGSQIDQLPGAKPLDWQELDIPHNLELLHKMEWLLRDQVKTKAAHEFKDWLKQFQRRAKNPANLPRIKQSRVLVEPDQPPQLVFSYEEAGSDCSAKKLAAWDKRFGAFLLLDDEIKKGHDWRWKRGYPFMYDNRLHFFGSRLSDKTHYLEWAASIDTFDGNKFRRGEDSGYQRTNVCGFSDTEIFYPPPRR